MLVKDIIEKLGAQIVNEGDLLQRDITGCYIGDLLSWVMANAREGDIWLTIMSNVNVVAVATLTDISCVLMCENVVPDEDCLIRAREQGITILKTPLSAYQAAVILGNIL